MSEVHGLNPEAGRIIGPSSKNPAGPGCYGHTQSVLTNSYDRQYVMATSRVVLGILPQKNFDVL